MARLTQPSGGGFGRSYSTGFVASVLCAIVVAVSAGQAWGARGTYGLRSHLKGMSPAIRTSSASGALKGKLKLAGKDSRFTWTLTFHHLSGKTMDAGIYFGRSAKPSALAMLLCTKCISGATSSYQGSLVAGPNFVRAIRRGRAYVVVRTKRHQRGEIRGRIKAKVG